VSGVKEKVVAVCPGVFCESCAKANGVMKQRQTQPIIGREAETRTFLSACL